MDILECYQKLDLKPECSWKELQAGYRRLVQKWHPDRYQQHPDQQHIAAHRMLEINEAYGILAQYYRQHGQLPFETPRRRTTAPELGTVLETPRAAPDLDFDEHLHSLQLRMARSRLFDLLPWLIIASILALGYYYLTAYHEAASLHINVDERALIGDTDATPVPRPASVPAPVPGGGYFTYGDPPGRVYEVQGVPTRTEGDLWLYGASEVYFENGVVSSWHSDPGHPLYVRDKPGYAAGKEHKRP